MTGIPFFYVEAMHVRSHALNAVAGCERDGRLVAKMKSGTVWSHTEVIENVQFFFKTSKMRALRWKTARSCVLQKPQTHWFAMTFADK